MISIKGLDKAVVLKALYDFSHVQGMGIFQAIPDYTLEMAQQDIRARNHKGIPLYFDYHYGRVLKVDISGDEFNEYLYDRDCGEGAAARAIDSIRDSNSQRLRVYY